ncbi:MAG: hypothetical protein ACJAXA_001474 [Candidatus Aldehydirespiratoraceae bacterium]
MVVVTPTNSLQLLSGPRVRGFRFSVNFDMSNATQRFRHRTLWAAAALAVTSVLVVTGSAPSQAALPVPASTVTASTNSPLLGEDVPLTVTFDDTTGPDYAPHVDLVFDSGGAGRDDGVSFGSANSLGAPFVPLAVFDGAGASQDW